MTQTPKILLFGLMLTSCFDNSPKNLPDKTALTDTIREIASTQTTTISSLKTDTLIVYNRTAVFVEPDSLRIEERKKKIGEEDFYIGADDYLFYMNKSSQFLDSVKLPIIESKGQGFIKFIRSDKSSQIIRLQSIPALWNIFLFEPTKNPKHIDILNTEEEYKTYFK